ncbi:C39 family peptidase [Branchiibius sp. NY16-3462-2]|uniref:C39 family peptidase n=1 Tax=Branchiibius sp. NY16-3462-2 TaxID=1807500 RepID=UPI0007954B60|nr:C39 family peptidase [Branchiibius sp. NY16-3462-2]KYH44092.1 hypothetical protein AZH51_04970 [Branchiibius sp. NY16-3462-2]
MSAPSSRQSVRSSVATGRLPNLSRRQLVVGGGALAAGGLLLGGPAGAASATTRAVTSTDQKIANHHFRAPFDFLRGSRDGAIPTRLGLRLGHTSKTRTYADLAPGSPTVTYDYGSWTSPWLSSGFALNELISSWNADTPNGTWIESQVRGVDETGTTSDWFVLGRWCSNDLADGGAISRTSVDDQATDIATVWTDTLHVYSGHTFSKVQLRILLMRKAGTRLTPTVSFFGAVASNLPDDVPSTSSFGLRSGIALPVPPYSQELHEGQYPQWDNGGEAWCSPTSTSMVVAYWRRGPSAKDLAWVEPKVDPQVAYAARNTYDAAYEGCGNWPFNTAYAGRWGLEAYVTRLRNLREAEPFLRAGIPLITSIAFEPGELDGAGYSTDGHLMVLAGFTDKGDVVMNDPASHLIKSDAAVRTTYRRDQFEKLWLAASGGTAYVIHPPHLRARH